MLLRDTIWSWWSHPLAVGSPEGTWLSGVDRRGNNVVHRIDAAGMVSVQLPGPVEVDDHNAAALAIDPAQSTLLAAYSRHDLDTHVRVQAVDRNTLTFSGAQQQVSFDGSCTYAQLMRHGSQLMLLCRVDTVRWCYRISHDWGGTWSSQQTLIDGTMIGQNYVTHRPDPADPALIHIAHVGHPVNSSWGKVGYIGVRLDTGDVVDVDGSVLANLATGPALAPAQLPVAIDPSPGYRLRVYDIGVMDGKPAVAFSYWSGPGWSNYRIKTWTGVNWVTDGWSLSSGPEFGHAADVHYHGGMAIGDDGQMWTSRDDSGVWRIESWQRTGGIWVAAGEIAQAETKLIRPYAVRDPAGHDLAWQDCLYEHYIRYYGDVEVTS